MKKSLLSIAGYDPSGGAGALLDVRVFVSLGFHGSAVLTEVFATFEFDRAVEIRRLRIYRDDSCIHLG